MPKGYQHLAYEERCQIYILNKSGKSQSEIARLLEVSRSTICRELARNRGKKGYRFKQAQEKADERRKRASRRPKKLDDSMITLIKEGLTWQWSPVQISGRMKQQDIGKSVSHETIYRYIWEDKRKGGVLYKDLRHRGKKYNRRGSSKAGRGCIPNRVDIDQRPAIVEKKIRVGDWELDIIIGSKHKGAIVSIVDRASKFTKLIKVAGKTSEEVTAAIITSLSNMKECVHTLTSDNGKEFSGHELVSAALDADFYFAKPYHSWQRGLNEHTNGLVRQYFPKGHSFDDITPEQVADVEILLNNRPRKVLDFQTPKEVFNKRSA